MNEILVTIAVVALPHTHNVQANTAATNHTLKIDIIYWFLAHIRNIKLYPINGPILLTAPRTHRHRYMDIPHFHVMAFSGIIACLLVS